MRLVIERKCVPKNELSHWGPVQSDCICVVWIFPLLVTVIYVFCTRVIFVSLYNSLSVILASE